MTARFSDAAPSKFYFGDAAPTKLYLGDSLFWQNSVTKAYFLETFDSGSNYSDQWVEYGRSGNQSLGVTSSRLQYSASIFTGGGQESARWVAAMANTDDQFVQADQGYSGNGSPTWEVHLRATANTERTYVRLTQNPNQSSWSIDALVDNTVVASASGSCPSGVGQITFVAQGYRYMAFKNGTMFADATDDSRLFVPGPDRRWSGLRLGQSQGNYNANIDNFAFGDY